MITPLVTGVSKHTAVWFPFVSSILKDTSIFEDTGQAMVFSLLALIDECIS